MWKIWVFVAVLGVVWGQSDFVPNNFEVVSKSPGGGFGAQDRCGEGALSGSICVPYYRCDPETNTTKPEEPVTTDEDDEITDYSLLINIRLGETNPCSETLHVCCKEANGQTPTSSVPTPTSSSTTPDEEPVTPKPTPSPPPPKPVLSYCGIRNNKGIDFTITGSTKNEAEYGEFPWMMAILKTDYNPEVDPVLAICGGSLLAPRVVLTGAHCVKNFTANQIKVRAGEWDTQTQNERDPYQERVVSQIIMHEKFKDGILINDVALLILEIPFKKARHIGTICLPEQNEAIDSRECYATGWGKNLFGKEGEYQVILKKIDLPIVPFKECENRLKETKLGNHFRLHSSFTCAGGIEGKDTCTGDGGSPLVCPDPKNPSRYVQAGVVAWGIGCGTTTPGVYVNVAKFRNWIDGHVQRLNLSNKPYTI